MMLTTHSMEEAEALCQRLGIFVSSRLKTIGAAAELKERYGQYYKILVTTPPGKEAPAFELLRSVAPSVRQINSLAGTASYEVARRDVQLSQIFVAIQENKARLSILDWGISNTTLEEVFLRITEAEAEDETAAFARNLQARGGCCGRRRPKRNADKTDQDEEVALDALPSSSTTILPLAAAPLHELPALDMEFSASHSSSRSRSPPRSYTARSVSFNRTTSESAYSQTSDNSESLKPRISGGDDSESSSIPWE